MRFLGALTDALRGAQSIRPTATSTMNTMPATMKPEQ
jgi:hypothetical protein